MKQEKTIDKIYNSRTFWVIVSLLCSFLLWSYVSGQDTKESTKTLTGIEIEFSGVEELEARSMAISEVTTGPVAIRVRGSRSDIARLRASEIKAVIDVSNIQQPNDMSWAYDIVFPDGFNENDVQIISRSPDTVNFTVVRITSKTINVKGSFEGTIAEDCVAEELIFEPATITVEGPEEIIDKIDCATVKFGEADTNIDTTYSSDVPYTLTDKDGNAVSADGIKASTDFVVAIQPVLKTKEIPLSIDLIAGGGISKDDCTLTIEPKSIKIAGDKQLIDGIDSVDLGKVNLSDLSSSFEGTYTISLNEELQNLTGTTEATVKISIPETQTKTFTVNNISCTNVTEGYKATIDTEAIEVVLRAKDAAVLESITADDISVVADLNDYGTTTGQVIAAGTVVVKEHSDVGAIGEVKVTLTISKE